MGAGMVVSTIVPLLGQHYRLQGHSRAIWLCCLRHVLGAFDRLSFVHLKSRGHTLGKLN
jgi:hypothetical protein